MAARRRTANRYYSGPPSDHFDGALFFNPGGKPPGRFTDLLKWQFGGGRAKWPAAFPSPHPPARPHVRVEGGALRLTMVGHASLLIQTAGLNILTDPGLVGARLAFRLCRPKKDQCAGDCLCRPAADRSRARQPQSLRPSRPRHAEAAEGEP
jgi:hypothetical protein